MLTLEEILPEPAGALVRDAREAMRVGLLNDEETERALQMTDDRNRTTHTYQIKVAQGVFERVPKYFEVTGPSPERRVRQVRP